jgi:hypothetical protein
MGASVAATVLVKCLTAPLQLALWIAPDPFDVCPEC